MKCVNLFFVPIHSLLDHSLNGLLFTVIVNGIFKIKTLISSYFHISSVQLLGRVRLFATP